MKYRFAALRFTEDGNLSDRVYWYLCDFPVKAGERVLAPVGSHDRLQAAEVERVLEGTEREAPYDLGLIKRVAAPQGARKLAAGGEELLEFGGMRYDKKRFTPFGRVVLAKRLPAEMEPLRAYGVTKTLQMSADDPALYEEIAHTTGCVLLVGKEGERAFLRLIALCRGEKTELPAETAELLLAKLLGN